MKQIVLFVVLSLMSASAWALDFDNYEARKTKGDIVVSGYQDNIEVKTTYYNTITGAKAPENKTFTALDGLQARRAEIAAQLAELDAFIVDVEKLPETKTVENPV